MQDRFPTARVVKSLNQLGHHQLEDDQRPKGAPDRIAIGAAVWGKETQFTCRLGAVVGPLCRGG